MFKTGPDVEGSLANLFAGLDRLDKGIDEYNKYNQKIAIKGALTSYNDEVSALKNQFDMQKALSPDQSEAYQKKIEKDYQKSLYSIQQKHTNNLMGMGADANTIQQFRLANQLSETDQAVQKMEALTPFEIAKEKRDQAALKQRDDRLFKQQERLQKMKDSADKEQLEIKLRQELTKHNQEKTEKLKSVVIPEYEFVPGAFPQAADKSEALKRISAMKEVNHMLTTLQEHVKTNGLDQIGEKAQRADSMYADFLLKYKEYAKLGVLTGPDVSIIESALPPASSMKATMLVGSANYNKIIDDVRSRIVSATSKAVEGYGYTKSANINKSNKVVIDNSLIPDYYKKNKQTGKSSDW